MKPLGARLDSRPGGAAAGRLQREWRYPGSGGRGASAGKGIEGPGPGYGYGGSPGTVSPRQRGCAPDCPDTGRKRGRQRRCFPEHPRDLAGLRPSGGSPRPARRPGGAGSVAVAGAKLRHFLGILRLPQGRGRRSAGTRAAGPRQAALRQRRHRAEGSRGRPGHRGQGQSGRRNRPRAPARAGRRLEPSRPGSSISTRRRRRHHGAERHRGRRREDAGQLARTCSPSPISRTSGSSATSTRTTCRPCTWASTPRFA